MGANRQKKETMVLGEQGWLQGAEDEIALKRRRRQRGGSLVPGTNAYTDCVLTAFDLGLGLGSVPTRIPSAESEESKSSTPREAPASPAPTAVSPTPIDTGMPPRAASVGFRPPSSVNFERTSSAPPAEREEEHRKTNISMFKISYSASPPPCKPRRPTSDTFVFDPSNVVKFTSSIVAESDLKLKPLALRAA